MLMAARSLAAAILALAVAAPALAVEASKVPEEKRTKLGLYVDAREAYALKRDLGAKALFVDVRTRAEAQYVGLPTVADAIVPLVELSPTEWDEKKGRLQLVPQKEFVAEVEARLAAAGLGKGDPVILICRSGDRSAKATDDLAAAGFTKVYTVVDGFEGDMSKAGRRDVNGWKNADLPWSYKLTKEKTFYERKAPLVPGR
jgi:rhodanese-related sulfurtransferase